MSEYGGQTTKLITEPVKPFTLESLLFGELRNRAQVMAIISLGPTKFDSENNEIRAPGSVEVTIFPEYNDPTAEGGAESAHTYKGKKITEKRMFSIWVTGDAIERVQKDLIPFAFPVHIFKKRTAEVVDKAVLGAVESALRSRDWQRSEGTREWHRPNDESMDPVDLAKHLGEFPTVRQNYPRLYSSQLPSEDFIYKGIFERGTDDRAKSLLLPVTTSDGSLRPGPDKEAFIIVTHKNATFGMNHVTVPGVEARVYDVTEAGVGEDVKMGNAPTANGSDDDWEMIFDF